MSEAVVGSCSVKKMFLKISQYLLVIQLQVLMLLKRGSNTVLFIEYCEIFKNIYFKECLQAAACKNVSKTYSMYSNFNPKDVFLSLLLTSLV